MTIPHVARDPPVSRVGAPRASIRSPRTLTLAEAIGRESEPPIASRTTHILHLAASSRLTAGSLHTEAVAIVATLGAGVIAAGAVTAITALTILLSVGLVYPAAIVIGVVPAFIVFWALRTCCQYALSASERAVTLAANVSSLLIVAVVTFALGAIAFQAPLGAFAGSDDAAHGAASVLRIVAVATLPVPFVIGIGNQAIATHACRRVRALMVAAQHPDVRRYVVVPRVRPRRRLRDGLLQRTAFHLAVLGGMSAANTRRHPQLWGGFAASGQIVVVVGILGAVSSLGFAAASSAGASEAIAVAIVGGVTSVVVITYALQLRHFAFASRVTRALACALATVLSLCVGASIAATSEAALGLVDADGIAWRGGTTGLVVAAALAFTAIAVVPLAAGSVLTMRSAHYRAHLRVADRAGAGGMSTR